MAAVVIPFNMSEELLEIVDAYATEVHKSRAQVIRDAVAQHVGVPELASLNTHRRPKYASAEEQAAAAKARRDAATKQRAAIKALIKAHQEGVVGQALLDLAKEAGFK